MSNLKSYIILVLSVLMVGCSRHAYDPEEFHIGFDIDMVQTKSLLSSSNLNTAGNRFVVYDVHQSGTALDQYMDDQCLEYRDAKWTFTKAAGGDEIRIPWTKKGVHHFMAYNAHDAVASKSLPVEVSYTLFEDEGSYGAKQQYFNIPAEGKWKLTMENQFDFLYSSAIRNVEADGYSPVPMSFKHLFAAVAVVVRNASTSDLTLEKLSFHNIKDTGSAIVDFDGNVTYDLSGASSGPLFQETPNSKITPGGEYTLYESLGAGNAFLIWPHLAAELAGAQIKIQYKHPDDSTEKTINLSENATIKNWTAGNRYIYRIDITDNVISFDVIKVVDWINDDIILEE